MALTFKKPVAPPKPEPPEYRVLTYPGEIRAAILSGKRFGLYVKSYVEEYQYQLYAKPCGMILPIKAVMPDKGNFIIGNLIQDPVDLDWIFHDQRIDDGNWTTRNLIFKRFWNLLEGGCRVKPGTEFRVYE